MPQSLSTFMHFISIYDGDGSGGGGDDGGVGGKRAFIAPVYISLWCGKFNLLFGEYRIKP